MLTVLIPTYNHDCVNLVREIARQISALDIEAEVLVVDDGSTDMSVLAANSAIESIDWCRYIVNPSNIGIAKTRNVLMDNAKYDLLLFLDSDVYPVHDDFILQYVRAAQYADVVVGGLEYRRGKDCVANPLRLAYGMSHEERTLRHRTSHPYASFNTSSFLIHRKLIEKVRFDETFDRYGHEDTLYGAQLQDAGASIRHIDAPVYHDNDDTAEQFLSKTRLAIQSLCMHADQLEGRSRLLCAYHKLNRIHMTKPMCKVFRLFKDRMESNLLGKHPSMAVLNIYKLSYMCGVMKLYSTSLEDEL